MSVWNIFFAFDISLSLAHKVSDTHISHVLPFPPLSISLSLSLSLSFSLSLSLPLSHSLSLSFSLSFSSVCPFLPLSFLFHFLFVPEFPSLIPFFWLQNIPHFYFKIHKSSLPFTHLTSLLCFTFHRNGNPTSLSYVLSISVPAMQRTCCQRKNRRSKISGRKSPLPLPHCYCCLIIRSPRTLESNPKVFLFEIFQSC